MNGVRFALLRHEPRRSVRLPDICLLPTHGRSTLPPPRGLRYTNCGRHRGRLNELGRLWLDTRATSYRTTTERIAIRTGVLNVRAADVPLYRIKDHSLDMPFWLRIFALGHVDLVTSDSTYPNIRLLALPNPDALRERLHQAIERARDIKGVRQLQLK